MPALAVGLVHGVVGVGGRAVHQVGGDGAGVLLGQLSAQLAGIARGGSGSLGLALGALLVDNIDAVSGDVVLEHIAGLVLDDGVPALAILLGLDDVEASAHAATGLLGQGLGVMLGRQ